jgi:hypothetical protein
MASVQHALHQMGAISPGAGETMMPMAAQIIAFEPVPSSQPRQAPAPAPPAIRTAPPPSPRARHPFRYVAVAAVLIVAGAIALVAHNRGSSGTASNSLVAPQDGSRPPVVLVNPPVTN